MSLNLSKITFQKSKCCKSLLTPSYCCAPCSFVVWFLVIFGYKTLMVFGNHCKSSSNETEILGAVFFFPSLIKSNIFFYLCFISQITYLFRSYFPNDKIGLGPLRNSCSSNILGIILWTL